MNFGREKVTWGQDQEEKRAMLWGLIDKAVEHECARTKVAARFLPLVGPLGEKVATVEADRIVLEEENDGRLEDVETLTVNETETTAIGEIFVQFALTNEQVAKEENLHTAVTLATRATNYLSQAEDSLIFRGQRGVAAAPLFKRIKFGRGSRFGEGLLNSVSDGGDEGHVLKVSPFAQDAQKPNKYRYGERTFAKVAEGISRLEDKGHYGPFALALHTDIFADAHAPLATTLIMPADRIRPLMDKEKDREGRVVGDMFYGTGTLPPFRGLLMSLGGNTVDRVVGLDPTTAFLQETATDGELAAGMWLFRVLERFALRLKDPTSLVRLEFLKEVVPDRVRPMAVGTAQEDGGEGAPGGPEPGAPEKGEEAPVHQQ
jgi:uncharacterized linocin/CFP29 family protein